MAMQLDSERRIVSVSEGRAVDHLKQGAEDFPQPTRDTAQRLKLEYGRSRPGIPLQANQLEPPLPQILYIRKSGSNPYIARETKFHFLIPFKKYHSCHFFIHPPILL